MLVLTKNGQVIKNVAPSGQFTLPNGDVVSPAYAGWSNGEYLLSEAPVEPEPDPAPEEVFVPSSISFAQLLIGLVAQQWITEAEGEAWLQGVLPNAVLTTIQLLPADQRFAAKARAARPSEVMRSDPLVEMMALAQGRSKGEIDDFFRTYAKA